MVTVQLEANGPITEMDPALLTRRDGSIDNHHEHTTWTEYWLADKLVHRSAHVTLKQGLESSIMQGVFGGQ